MSRIIGLTGGIGSGKSTAAAYLREKGLPVLDADAYARRALDPGCDCFEKALALFGTGVQNPDGSLSRAAIASRVFADDSLRQKLNGIIHPYVLACLQAETARQNAPRTVWEVPLLFESGFDRFCARTVAVLADREIRIGRIVRRDGMTEAQAAARIAAQMSDAERAKRAADTITNNGTEAELRRQLDALLADWEKDV